MADAPKIRKLCVFCGASPGKSPKYIEAAKALGRQMVKENISLVYGGGTVGLMGVIAREVAAGLGPSAVLGVIPAALAPREISGDSIGELVVVDDMHARKALMAQHADGFVAMPGGFGTLEEILEVITWQQLGFHTKPIAFYNMDGFYDTLLQFFQHVVQEGFIRVEHSNTLVSSDPADLIQQMRDFNAPVSIIASRLESKVPVGLDISISSAEADQQSDKLA